MIKWKRVKPGIYESEDGRFTIKQNFSRSYINPWLLQDNKSSDQYKGIYDEKTLRDCKVKAEDLK